MGLNKRELTVIAETSRDNYSIEIKVTAEGLWQAAINMIQPEKRYEILTSRGELKTWRSLDGAVTFVQDTCDECKDVTISIGTWKFTRIV